MAVGFVQGKKRLMMVAWSEFIVQGLVESLAFKDVASLESKYGYRGKDVGVPG